MNIDELGQRICDAINVPQHRVERIDLELRPGTLPVLAIRVRVTADDLDLILNPK